MKKKLTLLFITIFIGIIIFGTTAFAERMYECPVTICFGSINKFEVTNVEHLPGKCKSRIYFNIETNGTLHLDILCFDASGIKLERIKFFDHTLNYVDVPDTTATIEFIDFKEGATVGEYTSFLYRKYVNVYSADGRTEKITDLQLPIYEMVGWYEGVTLYAQDGRSIEVSPFKVEEYKQVGWYESITMYAQDGRTIEISPFEIELYKQVGWYNEPVVLMYAIDNRTLYVIESEVNIYKNLGWYESVTMYTEDGRTKTVSPFEVDLHKSLNWYESITMYAKDGRTIEISPFEIDLYEDIGWYEGVTMYAKDGRTIEISPFEIDLYGNVGWYEGVTMCTPVKYSKTIEVSPFDVKEFEKNGWIKCVKNVYITSDFKMVLDNLPDFVTKKNVYNKAKYEKKYGILLLEAVGIYYAHKNTEYEKAALDMRDEAIEICRQNSDNQHLSITDHKIIDNVVSFCVENISDKSIVSFRCEIIGTDFLNNVVKKYKVKFDSETLLKSVYSFNGTLDYFANCTFGFIDNNISSLEDIRVTEVVFSDGTKWVR